MILIRDHRFSTERLLINEWKSFSPDEWPRQDLPGIVMEVLTERVTQSLPPSWQGKYTLNRADQWIKERDDEGVTLLVVEQASQRAIGMIVLFESDDSAHFRLGYMLAETAWGQGFASELIAGFVEWCREHEIRSVTGGVERDNLASRRVLEKCGFVAEPAAAESEEQLFKIEL